MELQVRPGSLVDLQLMISCAAHVAPGMKLLMENVLQFVEELHTRVRHVESLVSERWFWGEPKKGDIWRGTSLRNQMQSKIPLLVGGLKHFVFHILGI